MRIPAVLIYAILIGIVLAGVVLAAGRAGAQEAPSTPTPTATATPAPASLEVRLVADPADTGTEFDFVFSRRAVFRAFETQEFDLEDDDVFTSGPLAAGRYRLRFEGRDGWTLESVRCRGDRDREGNTITFDLEAGEHERCTFVVRQAAPTPSPTATPTPTVVPATPQPVIIREPVFVPVERTVVVQATPQPVATQAPVIIRPPATGDGGLQ